MYNSKIEEFKIIDFDMCNPYFQDGEKSEKDDVKSVIWILQQLQFPNGYLLDRLGMCVESAVSE